MRSDLAYCAGLFEGEGSVGVKRSGPDGRYAYPCAQVHMTDLEPLERLHGTLGGNLSGPYDAPGGRKPRWTWTLNGFDKVEQLYGLIGEWLGPRRCAQFEKALSVERHQPATHCVRGHAFDAENTWTSPDGTKRRCRACDRKRAKERTCR